MHRRLREIRKNKGKGWTLERVAALIAEAYPDDPLPSASDISRLETGVIPLTPKWLEKFSKVLDTSIAAILGEAAALRTVPLVGYVGAGDLYYPDPIAGPWVGFDCVDAPPGGEGVVAVKVKGHSMAPVYRDGDLLFFSRTDALAPSDSIDDDCIVQVRNGPTYIKQLCRGSKPGRFRLHSYHHDTNDMDNVDVEWAAPVLHVTRARGTRK